VPTLMRVGEIFRKQCDLKGSLAMLCWLETDDQNGHQQLVVRYGRTLGSPSYH